MTDNTRFAFRDGFNGLRDALSADAQAGLLTFSATSRQVGGLHSRVSTRNFFLDVDEPEALGGTDKGPNPVELILAALASCQEITYRLYADRLGIPLDGISVHLEGDIDLSGFTAANETVRPGFTAIRGSVDIDSPASPAQLKHLKATVDRFCPVLDIVGQATPVSLEITPAAAHISAAE
jgi:putative redox protein